MLDTFSQTVLDRSCSRRTYLQVSSAAAIGLFVRPRFALAQSPTADTLPEFSIVAVEYSYELPAEAPSGWTRVTLSNQGTMDHHAMLLKLRDPSKLADLETALGSPDLGAIFALADSLGGVGTGPGMSATALIDLTPGQYMAICVIPGEDGIPHYLQGQHAPFSVTESDAAGTPPSADLSVQLSEMVFTGVPADVSAGAQIWEVSNTGEQVHEMTILRLADGMTIEQGYQVLGVGAAAASPDDAAMASMQGPPFVGIAGIAPMGPGQTNLLELDLTPGNYLAVCFVPDVASGAPHFMMGMTTGFTVA